MTTKEKFEEAKRLYETANADQRYVLESLFPELKESDDERIRKEIISAIKEDWPGHTDWIAWLEKQAQKSAWSEKYIADVFEKVGLAKIAREQGYDALTKAIQSAMIELSKFTPQPKQEWSEENDDEAWLNDIICKVESDCTLNKDEQNWLKDLKNRVQPRPKQEWSESDKDRIEELVVLIQHSNYTDGVKRKVISWLDSLKDRVQRQSQWKPSEEQMEALDDAIDICSKQNNEIGDWLDNLREQLEKLREEGV